MSSSVTGPPSDSACRAEFLLAYGRLTQADSVEEIAELLPQVLRSVTTASEARLYITRAESEGYVRKDSGLDELLSEQSLGAAAIEAKQMLVIEKIDLGTWSSEPMNRPETESLAAWPIPIDELGCALVVAWSSPNQMTDEDKAILECLVTVIGKAMQRQRVMNELGVLTESRTQSLQAVNEELETFAYTMSHDLKTPLTVIKTSVWTVRQLLKDRLDERSTLAMDRLETTVERMRGQVEGMLDMHRLTNEDLRPEEVNITELANEVVESLRSVHHERQVEVEIAPSLIVRGDPTMMSVVVENFVENAWKYTSKTPKARIVVGSSLDENGGKVIYIEDNGAGFDMEKADRLFGVFQRLHTAEEFDGTGIGLASVQRIINKHGGRVWASSEQGHGSTFYFSLPDELPTEDRNLES